MIDKLYSSFKLGFTRSEGKILIAVITQFKNPITGYVIV